MKYARYSFNWCIKNQRILNACCYQKVKRIKSTKTNSILHEASEFISLSYTDYLFNLSTLIGPFWIWDELYYYWTYPFIVWLDFVSWKIFLLLKSIWINIKLKGTIYVLPNYIFGAFYSNKLKFYSYICLIYHIIHWLQFIYFWKYLPICEMFQILIFANDKGIQK